MSTAHNSPPTSPNKPYQDEIGAQESPKAITFAEPLLPPARRQSSITLSSGSPKSIGDVPEWNDVLEDRLVHVQSELHKAQRRWSESQNIWLEEVQYTPRLRLGPFEFSQPQPLNHHTKSVELHGLTDVLRTGTSPPRTKASPQKSPKIRHRNP